MYVQSLSLCYLVYVKALLLDYPYLFLLHSPVTAFFDSRGVFVDEALVAF